MKYSNIGKKIKYYREEKELTQEQLADRVGVSWEMISRYERGVNDPFKKIYEIADALEISIEELFKKNDVNKNEYSYTIPLFTKIPKDFEFKKENTTFFYSCPKWVYEKADDVFALDGSVAKEKNSVYYISKKTYPYRKNVVLAVKNGKLIIDNFKNQKVLIGTVIAQEKSFV